MTRLFLFVSIAASTGLVAAGYLTGGYPLPAVVILLLGAGWAAGMLRRWTWLSALGLSAVYGFAAAGFFLDLTPAILISGSLFALLAWDLTDFSARLRLAGPQDDVRDLERRHFLRLFAVLLAGAALSFAVPVLHVKFTFEWSAILVLFGIWGIGRVINRLLQKGE